MFYSSSVLSGASSTKYTVDNTEQVAQMSGIYIL